MPVTIETLERFACFRKLTSASLKRLAQNAAAVRQPSGAEFFRQGDAPTGLFALQTGRVKLYRQSKEQVQILAIPMPGECFGAESLPDDTPSPCTATSLTPANALYFPPDLVRSMLTDSPDMQIVLLELVSFRLRQFVSLVHDLAFRDVSARLAIVLLARAEAEGQPSDNGICIERLLSQQDFAAMVGTAREVIYRTFKKFEQDGVVHLTSSCIFILDPARLAEIARQETR